MALKCGLKKKGHSKALFNLISFIPLKESFEHELIGIPIQS
jgi:hypothetical protein